MWNYLVEISQSQRTHKFTLLLGNKQLTYLEVIELWQGDRDFRTFFISLLSSAKFAAYFWETPPINISNVTREFEFVLIESPQLAKINPNPNPFRKYFASAPPNTEVITFSNLRNDALLVVPCRISESNTYTHLASFVRKANEFQNHSLWQILGKTIQEQLNDEPLWISTSGLGVYWLHIRLDSYPKYYHFKPYKN